MSKKVYYEKENGRYVPVSEHDHDLLSSLTEGHHLVYVQPNVRRTHARVQPDHVTLLAALDVVSDHLSKAIVEAFELRRTGVPNANPNPASKEYWKESAEAEAAWAEYRRLSRSEMFHYHWESPAQMAREISNALLEETKELLENPAVKSAHDRLRATMRLAIGDE